MIMPDEIDVLADLLRQEADYLRSGDIAKLQGLAPKKERAWERAQRRFSKATPLADLVELQDIARHNAKLLVAARAGLDAARQKTAKAKMPREALSTYTATGAKRPLSRSTNGESLG